MKKRIFITLLLASQLVVVMACNNAMVDEINGAFKSGNTAVFSKYFNTNVDFNLPNSEGLYSKSQAEQILKDFFSKNPPRSFTVIHQGESKDGALYVMGTLVTPTATYRTYCYFKKSGDSYLIKELRIE